jgi:uncharacterized protein YcbK (DUF882 family)
MVMSGLSKGVVETGIGRRSILRLGMAGMASFVANPAAATLNGICERKLALHNLHTGETIRTTFWVDGIFQSDTLRDIDFVLRDFRTGDVCAISISSCAISGPATSKKSTRNCSCCCTGFRKPPA